MSPPSANLPPPAPRSPRGNLGTVPPPNPWLVPSPPDLVSPPWAPPVSPAPHPFSRHHLLPPGGNPLVSPASPLPSSRPDHHLPPGRFPPVPPPAGPAAFYRSFLRVLNRRPLRLCLRRRLRLYRAACSSVSPVGGSPVFCPGLPGVKMFLWVRAGGFLSPLNRSVSSSKTLPPAPV